MDRDCLLVHSAAIRSAGKIARKRALMSRWRRTSSTGFLQSFNWIMAVLRQSLAGIDKVIVMAFASMQLAGCERAQESDSSSSHDVSYLMATMIIVLVVITIVLAKRNYRYSKAQNNVKRQHAEITHAARLALVGEITASVTHEVTQPLSAILNNVETAEILLSKPTPDIPLLREILADVRKDDMRAYDIVRKLRALLHKRELQMEDVDINSLTANVLALVRSDALRRSIELRAMLDPGGPRVLADPVHLQQVLLNLIINGMDAMEDMPAARRKLEVYTACLDEHVEVAVVDHGKGVQQADSGKLFEAFFTTKPDGMGLGLSIARSIIALHGGSIWAENCRSGGSIFRFTLRLSAPRISH